ncbi:hypothetical protein K503DRAFT_778091 [Rhizopogon vinicolor AM-OR11-026]|uniref:Uncharacterized protein n=1 Tax=Rhizopogon vinicolor AM-OR11-026 TaxID=1314800 RepID=A0A1B7MDH2_9AGAM|nr:hypothetical protein K503DRAFT_778091 [Rhizopogon vinicolor AM-OR11-026]
MYTHAHIESHLHQTRGWQSEGSPHNACAAPGQGRPSSNPTGSVHGTAPPTPNTIHSSIT